MDEIRKLGFFEGFNGQPAREVSLGYNEQTIYLDAYQQGKEHRQDVNVICAKENINLIGLMTKAVALYKKTNY